MSKHSGDPPDAPVFERGWDGLLPAIAQDVESGEVLMMAYMNREAFEESRRTGCAVYYSRSRKRLWRKGEQSGNVQRIREIRLDCDGDAILLLVEQKGPACHQGYRSCFFRAWTDGQWRTRLTRLQDPADMYAAPHAGDGNPKTES